MRVRPAKVLLAVLALVLISAPFVAIVPAGAEATQTCTPSTCEAVQPPIVVKGYAAVQMNPEPPVFGGLMYVANTGSDTVSAIMNVTNVANITVGPSPGEPVYDDFNGYLYVPNLAGDNVSVINPVTNRLVGNITTGSLPEDVAYDPVNGYLYVVNGGSGTISIISTSSTSEPATDWDAPGGI